jgi:hypothetical protein
MTERLPTELWIQAHLRRCSRDAIAAYVVRRGDAGGGTLLLKINRLEHGWRLLTQIRDLDGRLGWMPALEGGPEAEPEAAAYIERAVRRDPDLWVVEIEDRAGRNPFDESAG